MPTDRRRSAALIDRRRFLGASGLALAATLAGSGPRAWAARKARGADFRVEKIERTTVRLPFRETPGRAMAREIPHWDLFEICEVTLGSGHVGFGETMLYYTWGVTSDEDVARAQGQNAAALMWDDSLGSGLQQALFDAVARALDVPLHRLLGEQVHDTTPLSWWNIDIPPADWVSECKEALAQGYLAMKTKGRPWFDIWACADAVRDTLPKDFKIGVDFNDTLLTADRGLPILKELEQTPQVAIFETPIPQSDVEGNVRIRQEVETPLALHYGTPRPAVVIKRDVCDGFVVGGGASRLIDTGAVAATADLPFWLQLVGSDITAAWSLHCGAVLSHATWPAVNCHQLFASRLLKEPIVVKEGRSAIPTGPGLGFELDRDALDRYRVEKPAERPDPPRLIETSWPDGRRMYTANTGRVNFMLTAANAGVIPYFERGVDSRLVPDDGSDLWRSRYQRARSEGPFLER
ncbi:mandelate racemase/muconate lactonizing enzyme family protein [Tautonia sociabilis]|uniref:DgoA protein n=1 Tax=Tautonia sociabilis TaxID=2080755 RepID=A0A432MNQ5_9BACT|nr:mandelate racemase/muconate lactonizing enzyme family protein [Tautonia sociabilis]RUL88708.1 dgoA protein [Tautonia sociabilis]